MTPAAWFTAYFKAGQAPVETGSGTAPARYCGGIRRPDRFVSAAGARSPWVDRALANRLPAKSFDQFAPEEATR